MSTSVKLTPGSTVDPVAGRGNRALGTTSCDSGAATSSAQNRATAHRRAPDPHGLRDSAPLAFAAYKVAIECHQRLLSRDLNEEGVLQRLHTLVPASAFQINYVGRQAFKFINPYGHGANSPRFRNETLGWFRQCYPEDAHLTAGFILLVCAARWWTHEQGHRVIIPRTDPLTTSDLDNKLKSLGFLSGERHAICRMLRRNQGQG